MDEIKILEHRQDGDGGSRTAITLDGAGLDVIHRGDGSWDVLRDGASVIRRLDGVVLAEIIDAVSAREG